MIELLLIVAAIVIVILVAVAAHLHWRLHKLHQARAAEEALVEKKRQERRESINESIQIIARALEAKQVGATEASIRISGLLDALDVENDVKTEFAAFYKLADDAGHIPILDAWKALSKAERKSYNKELVALETKHQDVILAAALRIQGRDF
jgi:hypothetical protein